MTCCDSPTPVRPRVVPFVGRYIVVSVCERCGTERRETPLYDLEAQAEAAKRRLFPPPGQTA